jgi:hypothetical protein
VEIDRQAIERRDFPIARRGYEPAAVDAHLRALASEIEALERERSPGGGESSLAASAGTQVQSILAAAEAAAAEIEQQARESAASTREQAERDAASTREEAIAQARAHVAAVAQATSVLLERVGTMDGEVSALVESLRAGAGRLANDLAALETNMGELYDATSGNAVTRAIAGQTNQREVPAPQAPAAPTPVAAAPLAPTAPPIPAPRAPAAPTPLAPAATPPPTTLAEAHADPEAPRQQRIVAAVPSEPATAAPTGDGELDSARLVALNMALNGESRESADRYLAENYQLADRAKLVDEVFAAIEA